MQNVIWYRDSAGAMLGKEFYLLVLVDIPMAIAASIILLQMPYLGQKKFLLGQSWHILEKFLIRNVGLGVVIRMAYITHAMPILGALEPH